LQIWHPPRSNHHITASCLPRTPPPSCFEYPFATRPVHSSTPSTLAAIIQVDRGPTSLWVPLLPSILSKCNCPVSRLRPKSAGKTFSTLPPLSGFLVILLLWLMVLLGGNNVLTCFGSNYSSSFYYYYTHCLVMLARDPNKFALIVSTFEKILFNCHICKNKIKLFLFKYHF